MRGVGVGMLIIFLILAVFSMAGVAGLFGKTILKTAQFTYVTFDYYTAHYIASKTEDGYALFDSEVKLPADFKGAILVDAILYDLKEKEVIFTTELNAEEFSEFLANRTPESPQVNFVFRWEDIPGGIVLKSLIELGTLTTAKQLTEEIEDFAWLSAFALPVRVKKGDEIHPALLIIVSRNYGVDKPMQKIAEFALGIKGD